MFLLLLGVNLLCDTEICHSWDDKGLFHSLILFKVLIKPLPEQLHHRTTASTQIRIFSNLFIFSIELALSSFVAPSDAVFRGNSTNHHTTMPPYYFTSF